MSADRHTNQVTVKMNVTVINKKLEPLLHKVLTVTDVRDIASKGNKAHLAQRITQQVWEHFVKDPSVHMPSTVNNSVVYSLRQCLTPCEQAVAIEDVQMRIDADYMHEGNMTNTAYKVHTGLATVLCDNFKVHTKNTALHISLDDGQLQTQITTVIFPQDSQEILPQHYLQSTITCPDVTMSLDHYVAALGKKMPDNISAFDKQASHRRRRQAQNKTHQLAFKSTGFISDFYDTKYVHTSLFAAYYTPIGNQDQGKCITLFW